MEKHSLNGGKNLHLRKAYNKKTERTYLSIVHGFRDKNGKPKSKVIKSLGYLDVLEKEFSNPISHFTALAKSMESERKASKTETITLDMEEQLEHGLVNRKNYGSIVFIADVLQKRELKLVFLPQSIVSSS